MSFSVLQLAPHGEYILYDSDKKKGIIMGSQSEMYDWKNVLDTIEHHQSNLAYMKALKEERLALLISAGHTQQTATEFLKINMPYLYE